MNQKFVNTLPTKFQYRSTLVCVVQFSSWINRQVCCIYLQMQIQTNLDLDLVMGQIQPRQRGNSGLAQVKIPRSKQDTRRLVLASSLVYHNNNKLSYRAVATSRQPDLIIVLLSWTRLDPNYQIYHQILEIIKIQILDAFHSSFHK